MGAELYITPSISNNIEYGILQISDTGPILDV